MGTKIRFTDGNKEYVLEFNRDAVSKLEQTGFRPTEVSDEPATMLPMLWNGAFQMHHPNTRFETTNALLAKMPNKQDLYTKLVEMYVEPILSLMDEPSEGKVDWQTE